MCYRVSDGLRPHRMKLAAICLALLAASVSGNAGAEDVNGLYEAEVPVDNQRHAERQTALSEALRAVLVKASGQRQPGRQPLVAKALRHASRLLLAYDYYRRQPPSLMPLDSESGTDKSDLMLRARFDPKAVESLLRRAELPVWGRARPSLLVWLAVEEGSFRYLIGQDTEHPLREAMISVAERRGLPLHLPRLDARDRADIQFMDIWTDFTDVVMAASQRYAVDRVLVGRVYRDPGGFWGARWSLYPGKQDRGARPLVWESQQPTPTEAVTEGLSITADSLAAQYAVHYRASYDQQGLVLEIQGVESLRDYVRISRYLESLESVIQVMPSQVEAGRLRVNLKLRGGINALHQAIALGRVLAAVPEVNPPAPPADPGLETSAPALRYRLLP